jgi:DNA-directed RNA polymerase subunit RPC12/RpoP
MDSIYVATLEKTNQQLALRFNPYGVMVGALSALVALLTIAAAGIIYRQGSEYKRTLGEAIKEQARTYQQKLDDELLKAKGVFDGFMSEKDKQFEELRKVFQEFLHDAQERGRTVAANPADVEANIKRLEGLVASMKTEPAPNLGFPSSHSSFRGATGPMGFSMMKKFKCSSCGTEYVLADQGLLMSLSGSPCPKCGTLNNSTSSYLQL